MKQFALNLDSHIICRLLVGSIEFELGDGVEMPRLATVNFGDTFVVRLFNFYSMPNTTNDEWSVLFTYLPLTALTQAPELLSSVETRTRSCWPMRKANSTVRRSYLPPLGTWAGERKSYNLKSAAQW